MFAMTAGSAASAAVNVTSCIRRSLSSGCRVGASTLARNDASVNSAFYGLLTL